MIQSLDIGSNIKRIREDRGLSQRDVITSIGMEAAQYNRIEKGKTNPSVTTIEKIAVALGVKTYELFIEDVSNQNINSFDKTLVEKLSLIEKLAVEEQKTIFSMLDAFVSKQKLNDTLNKVIDNIK
jgi:transcriptional regulator with XRE-family HTH domain